MHYFYLAAWYGFLFVVFGLYHLLTPLDKLWQRQMRVFLKTQIEPQRSQKWETFIRRIGWTFVTLGITLPVAVNVALILRLIQ